MCIQDDGMFNVKMILSKVTIGNGKSMVSPKLGDIWMSFQTKEGKKMFLLEDVKYVPELCVNLLNIKNFAKRIPIEQQKHNNYS